MNPVFVTAVLAIANVGSMPLAFAETVLHEVARITLPNVRGRIDHMAVDLSAKHVFVAALGNRTIEVVDVQSRTVLRSLRGFQEPQGILQIPGSKRVLVTNAAAEYGTVLDSTAFEVQAQVPLPEDSDNIRYDAKSGLAWIGAGASPEGFLLAVDTATNKVVKKIALRGHPESFQLEQQGPRIFVNVPTAKVIQVIDRDTGQVTADWKVPAKDNFPMALDEGSHRLFVGTRSPARLLVYDTNSGEITSSLDTVGDSDDVFYDAQQRRVYVSGGGGYVFVYQQTSPDKYSLAQKVETGKGARTSLFIADWHMLFVAVPAKGESPAEIRIYDTKMLQ